MPMAKEIKKAFIEWFDKEMKKEYPPPDLRAGMFALITILDDKFAKLESRITALEEPMFEEVE
jgi:hypothetical protein